MEIEVTVSPRMKALFDAARRVELQADERGHILVTMYHHDREVTLSGCGFNGSGVVNDVIDTVNLPDVDAAIAFLKYDHVKD